MKIKNAPPENWVGKIKEILKDGPIYSNTWPDEWGLTKVLGVDSDTWQKVARPYETIPGLNVVVAPAAKDSFIDDVAHLIPQEQRMGQTGSGETHREALFEEIAERNSIGPALLFIMRREAFWVSRKDIAEAEAKMTLSGLKEAIQAIPAEDESGLDETLEETEEEEALWETPQKKGGAQSPEEILQDIKTLVNLKNGTVKADGKEMLGAIATDQNIKNIVKACLKDVPGELFWEISEVGERLSRAWEGLSEGARDEIRLRILEEEEDGTCQVPKPVVEALVEENGDWHYIQTPRGLGTGEIMEDSPVPPLPHHLSKLAVPESSSVRELLEKGKETYGTLPETREFADMLEKIYVASAGTKAQESFGLLILLLITQTSPWETT